MGLKDLVDKDSTVLLEVPEHTDQKEVVELLERYKFSLAGDRNPISFPSSTGKKRTLYTIHGPRDSYEKLETEARDKGYSLWANPKLEPFQIQ